MGVQMGKDRRYWLPTGDCVTAVLTADEADRLNKERALPDLGIKILDQMLDHLLIMAQVPPEEED